MLLRLINNATNGGIETDDDPVVVKTSDFLFCIHDKGHIGLPVLQALVPMTSRRVNVQLRYIALTAQNTEGEGDWMSCMLQTPWKNCWAIYVKKS